MWLINELNRTKNDPDRHIVYMLDIHDHYKKLLKEQADYQKENPSLRDGEIFQYDCGLYSFMYFRKSAYGGLYIGRLKPELKKIADKKTQGPKSAIIPAGKIERVSKSGALDLMVMTPLAFYLYLKSFRQDQQARAILTRHSELLCLLPLYLLFRKCNSLRLLGGQSYLFSDSFSHEERINHSFS